MVKKYKKYNMKDKVAIITGGECTIVQGDVAKRDFCKEVMELAIKKYGKIDILVNNAAVQYECTDIKQITDEQFDKLIIKMKKIDIFET